MNKKLVQYVSSCVIVLIASCMFSITLFAEEVDYYPLKEGNTWSYQVLGRPEAKRSYSVTKEFIEDGKKTYLVENLSKHTFPAEAYPPNGKVSEILVKFYIQVDDKSVTLKRDLTEVDKVVQYMTTYEPPKLMFKKPYKKMMGKSFELLSQTRISSPVEDDRWMVEDEELNQYVVFLSAGTVETPAGTFRDCIEVISSESADSAADEKTHVWLAPNVGMVKTQFGGNAITMVLAGYKLAKEDA